MKVKFSDKDINRIKREVIEELIKFLKTDDEEYTEEITLIEGASLWLERGNWDGKRARALFIENTPSDLDTTHIRPTPIIG